MATRQARTRQAVAPAKRLAGWMDDVVRLRKRLLRRLDEKRIHDLRVALRRCRTVGQGMRASESGGRWRELEHKSRKLLHALGALRDTQVLAELAERTAPHRGRLRDRVLRALQQEGETHDAKEAHRALQQFDVTAWRQLGKRIAGDAAIRSMTRDRARRIALRWWTDAADAHDVAMRTARPEMWHAARIAWKRLRYSLEAFAPDLHEQWDAALADLQTTLGEVHDLDSLSSFVRTHARKSDRTALKRWLVVIEVNRTVQITHYNRLTRRPRALWRAWGAALVGNNRPA